MKLNQHSILIEMARNGLTQAALATNIGLTPQYLGQVLKRGDCSPVTAGKIARGLNIDVTEIIFSEVSNQSKEG